MERMDSFNENQHLFVDSVDRGEGQTLVLEKQEKNIEGADLLVTTSIVVSDEKGGVFKIEGNQFIPDGWELIDAADIKLKDKGVIPDRLKGIWIASRQRDDAERSWPEELIGLTDPESKLVLFSADSHKGSIYALLHELGHAQFNDKNPQNSQRRKEIADKLNATENLADIPKEDRQEFIMLLMENEYQADLWAMKMLRLVQTDCNLDLEPALSNQEILMDFVGRGHQMREKSLQERLGVNIPDSLSTNFLNQAKSILDLQ